MCIYVHPFVCICIYSSTYVIIHVLLYVYILYGHVLGHVVMYVYAWCTPLLYLPLSLCVSMYACVYMHTSIHISHACHGHGHGHGLFISATYHKGKCDDPLPVPDRLSLFVWMRVCVYIYTCMHLPIAGEYNHWATRAHYQRWYRARLAQWFYSPALIHVVIHSPSPWPPPCVMQQAALCVCMYVCVYFCMYVFCMYVCMYYVCIYECMYACMYVCMYVYKNACMYACMRVYTFTCMLCMLCMYACAYT